MTAFWTGEKASLRKALNQKLITQEEFDMADGKKVPPQGVSHHKRKLTKKERKRIKRENKRRRRLENKSN